MLLLRGHPSKVSAVAYPFPQPMLLRASTSRGIAVHSWRRSYSVSKPRSGGELKKAETPKAPSEIFWSNPKQNLDRVPDAVVYSLPPPMRAPFPETLEEKRKRVIKSWLPGAVIGVAALIWYTQSTARPAGTPDALDAVPDFLQKALIARQKAVALGAAQPPSPPVPPPTEQAPK